MKNTDHFKFEKDRDTGIITGYFNWEGHKAIVSSDNEEDLNRKLMRQVRVAFVVKSILDINAEMRALLEKDSFGNTYINKKKEEIKEAIPELVS